jgi:hypothetical protein
MPTDELLAELRRRWGAPTTATTTPEGAPPVGTFSQSLDRDQREQPAASTFFTYSTQHAKAIAKPLGCPLDHRDPASWRTGPDNYGRPGFERIECRWCGRFYGYRGVERGRGRDIL